jgi:hypothetical protein
MSPATSIQMPATLTAFSVLPWCKEFNSIKMSGEVVLDFSRTTTVEPFGMLLVASEIRRHFSEPPLLKVSCRNYERMTYAAHMGFFKAFDFDFGLAPGQAHGSRNYLPLTYFDSEQLTREAARQGVDIGSEVERQSERLTATLIGSDEGDVFETLSYAIREIMRNVLEHSHANRFGFCAQYWPTKGKAEVAIVDAGIGLQESIRANPHIDASSHKSAINYALMPAVSGKAFKGARGLQKRGPWTNSGFGLYLTSRICRNGGNFLIASGDTAMLLTSGKDGKRYMGTSIPGTAVRLTIRTENVDSLRNSLAKFRQEGFEIQKRYSEIVRIDPSSASLMLSRDFDLNLWDQLLMKLRLG